MSANGANAFASAASKDWPTNRARALDLNLNTVFRSFGHETVTRGSHLEKLCLIADGVGKDNISDLTTTLIKDFLLRYTETFAQAHIAPEQRRRFTVEKVRFNYDTETWERGSFEHLWTPTLRTLAR